jgi:hypothetical protein
MRLLVLSTALLLAACAGGAHEGINAPMHDVGGRQVGWEEGKVDGGDVLFVIRSSGASTDYHSMMQAAERHASQRCPYGYRVMSVGGADQPEVDILNPRLILGAELRFEVHCFERDSF